MINSTRLAGVSNPAVRFGNDTPQVLAALNKISQNPQDYSVNVQLNEPTRSQHTINASNKSSGKSVRIVSHLFRPECSIQSNGVTYSSTDSGASAICQQLLEKYGPSRKSGSGKSDIDI